jgi:hypothetical protein
VTVRLNGNRTAQVVSDGAGRTLHAVLADDVRNPAAAGRRLDFVPLGALDGQARGTGEPT